ncbi:winged helix-turn-helix domain-containing protein [Streptomyces niveus]|uniref:winged helix-turn-helix domain-containing protein n=1 Tax=Streptomyces niveus TaxID=193462 RepID=UPI0035D63ABF
MPTDRPSDPLPVQIANKLRARIEDGKLPQGGKLPSQRALAEDFKVSRETIKGALDRLESEGFIKTRQGARSEVTRAAEVSAPGEEADEISVVRSRQIHTDARSDDAAARSLESVIERAFLAKDVTLDAFSLTTESLGRYLGKQLDAVGRGDLRPDSIRLRLMLPSGDSPLAYPAAVDQGDSRPFERWDSSAKGHLTTLKNTISMVSDSHRSTTDIRLEIKRLHSVTPQVKIYILNNETLLHGVYALVERNMILDDDSVVPALDVLGLQSNLFHYLATDSNTQGPLHFTEYQAMFEGLWRHAHGTLSVYPSADG